MMLKRHSMLSQHQNEREDTCEKSDDYGGGTLNTTKTKMRDESTPKSF